jgi:hypothetical protein
MLLSALLLPLYVHLTLANSDGEAKCTERKVVYYPVITHALIKRVNDDAALLDMPASKTIYWYLGQVYQTLASTLFAVDKTDNRDSEELDGIDPASDLNRWCYKQLLEANDPTALVDYDVGRRLCSISYRCEDIVRRVTASAAASRPSLTAVNKVINQQLESLDANKHNE